MEACLYFDYFANSEDTQSHIYIMKEHQDDELIWKLEEQPDKAWKHYSVKLRASRDMAPIMYFKITGIDAFGMIAGFDNIFRQPVHNGACPRNGGLKKLN